MAPSPKSTLSLLEAPTLTYNHGKKNIESLIQQLQSVPPYISHTFLESELRSKSHTPHSPAAPYETPCAVFYPRSTEEVSRILSACHTLDIAVTSFGGGTSLPGALTATRGGICIDFKNMKGVLEVHEEDQDVRVQPGIGWVELNEQLSGRGFWVPVDPARGASIGGMIAMSCSGTNAYRYGTMKSHILSLTLVLADGTIVKTRNRPRKSSAGYDLTSLICGSEGTLALVTEAILRLTPLPQNLHVGIATFESMQKGVDAVTVVLKSGTQLEALELVDAECMRAINHSGLALSRFAEQATLFLKLAGSAQSVQEQIGFVTNVCHEHGGANLEFTQDKERIDVIWGARKCLGHALVSMKKQPDDLFLSTDAAVPVSKLAKLVDESQKIVEREAGDQGWFCGSVGHVGDGNVHTAIVCPLSSKALATSLLLQIQRLALELEGTITGEHGIGLKLRDLLIEEVGTEGVDMMRRIKRALDPKGILNPDKVVRLEDGI